MSRHLPWQQITVGVGESISCSGLPQVPAAVLFQPPSQRRSHRQLGTRCIPESAGSLAAAASNLVRWAVQFLCDMVLTRAETAAGPLALFEALLAGKPALARRLLEGPEAAQLQHVGPAGFSTLHAAVLAGAADLLPALAAAGSPLNGELEDYFRPGAPLWSFARSFSGKYDYQLCY